MTHSKRMLWEKARFNCVRSWAARRLNTGKVARSTACGSNVKGLNGR